MKKTLFVALALLVAVSAGAQNISDLNPMAKHFWTKDHVMNRAAAGGAGNLSYHGGPVMHGTRVVAIFWGPSWASGGSDAANASTIMNFISQFGTSSHTAMLTQYYDGSTVKNYITQSALGSTSWNDTSLPPTNCTDAIIQGEVSKYLSTHAVDANTIYEVFLPATSYSSDGTSTSCGGPNLAYCAYHSHYTYNGTVVKYSSQPYPSCSGCSNSGWTAVQNMTMFIGHETREAWTDALGTAWYDRRGYEADDKCAWKSLFLDGGFGYQPEWSNSAAACVK